MLRTQIYLPEKLRREIDRDRAWRGESLAEYARQAMKNRAIQGKKKKTDLKKLADMIRNMRPTRTKREAKVWIQDIREDRKLSDERLERRWAEANQKTNVHTRQ